MRVERKEMELSLAQKNIYDIMISYPELPIANVGGLLWLKGEISYERMQWCTNVIRKKYSTLRMRFAKNKKLYVVEYQPEPLREADFTGLSEKEFRDQIKKWFCEPFSWYHSSLCEIALVRWNQKSLLFGRFHHLIMDGTAILNILREYEACYEKGEEVFDLTDTRFEDYLRQKVWEKPSIFKRAGEFFEKEFKTIDINWKLKEDRKDPRAMRREMVLNQELSKQLYVFSQEKKITIESIIMGTLYCYISQVKSVSFVAIGRGMVNRSKEELSMISMMTNMLPLLMEGKKEELFSSLCKMMKNQLFSLMRYASYGYHEMKQMLARPESLFDIAVSYRMTRLLPIVGNGVSEELFNGYSEIPLRLFIDDDLEQIRFVFQYQTVCYKEMEIEALMANFLHILKQIPEDKRLGEIGILGEEEIKRIEAYNQIKAFPIPKSVWEQFDFQRKRVPNRIIWKEETQEFTYEEAVEIVNDIAKRLFHYGVRRGDIVALQLKRTHLLPASMLACLRLGAAFFPIGKQETKERVQMLTTGCKLILTEEQLETDDLKKEKEEELVPFVPPKPSDMAYCITTSGSTGNTKIAMLSQKGLALRLQWMHKYLKENGLFTKGEVPYTVLQKTVNTFDVSVWELLFPAIYGQSLFMLADKEERYPDKIARVLKQQEITLVHFVPSMLAAFLNYVKEKKIELPKLHTVIASGEALTPELVRQFYHIFPHTMLHNFYGPAECTIDVCAALCKKEEVEVSLGNPAYGTKLYVVNKSLSLLPAETEGELLIVGELVGKGYWNNEEETKKNFIKWKGECAYRSGDRVKFTTDGRLVYLGRMNQEVKLRGMRIDLSEIEHQMCRCSCAKQVVVQIINNQLLAFYTADEKIEDWWERLCGVLPSYAVPVRFYQLFQMPINQNGKLDQKAFEKILQRNIEKKNKEKKYSQEEHLLIKIIAPYLKGVSFDAEDNLLRLGLDSLSIISILVALEKKEIEISFSDFYRQPTVRWLAKIARKKRKGGSSEGIWTFLEDGRIAPFKKKEEKSQKLLLCIPYAGGEVSLFLSLAKEMQQQGIQTVVVDSYYYKNCSVWEMAKDIKKKLPVYQELLILGCCVGAALAIELASSLQHTKLYLCEAMPRKQFKIGEQKHLIWDYLGATQTNQLLSLFAGKRMQITNKERRQLCMDAKKSAQYFESKKALRTDKKTRSGIFTVYIYGTKDILSVHYKRRCRLFEAYGCKKKQLYEIKGGKHFLVASHSHILAQILVDGKK